MTLADRPAVRASADDDDDERALWDALKGRGADLSEARSLRERLFDRHAEFARRIARRHYRDRSGGDVEYADLVQLACAGLLEAIDHFDVGRGIPFRGYAGRRIAGSILDGIAQMSEMREQIAFRARLRADRARSLSSSATQGEAWDAGEAMEMLAEVAVGLAIGFMLEGTGLYHADSERTPAAGPNAYESLGWKQAVGRVRDELENLPARDRAIIRQHYHEGMTFEDIGTGIGVTKGRVSQLHASAIALLRKRLVRIGDFRLQR